MKRIIVISILCLFLTGCGLLVSRNNVETWVAPENAKFVPVDTYKIEDGTVHGIKFTTYVNLDDGTMWLYTSSFDTKGTTFVKLTDENNNARIYEDLETLREKY